MSSISFGRIDRNDTGWIIDAEPFVMMRARPLFPYHKKLYRQGHHTHSPIELPRTRDAAKDLLWLMERFPLNVSDNALSEIRPLAELYDRAIAAVHESKSLQLSLSADAFQFATPPFEWQLSFAATVDRVLRTLCADDIGVGKTGSALLLTCELHRRPAIIVTPPHLCTQWMEQCYRFLPDATVHIIKGIKPYVLPECDILITSYNRLGPWQDVLTPLGLKTVIFEEVHELRRQDTVKRQVSKALSELAEVCVGLSATPIYNYGSEIWSVMDAISPGCLGSANNFQKEWCGCGDRVGDTIALNSYLTSMGLMIRRTNEDVGRDPMVPIKTPITLDADLSTLQEIQDVAKMLALSVLGNKAGESAESARELDWKLRHATGVAKAKSVAEFVKMLTADGEKVLLAGWHRDVYDIWLNALKDLHPVMYTGSESVKGKDDAKREFVEGNSKVLIMSLRSGAGVDGLQHVCSRIVLGELDWSPQVMDQIVGRLNRPGQKKPVMAYYMTIDDGSDPFMMNVIGAKRSQHDGIVEGKDGQATLLDMAEVPADRIRELAIAYLESIGVTPPITIEREGLHAEVVSILERMTVPVNSEKEMQSAIWQVLPEHFPDCEREYRIGARGRIDFIVRSGSERVGIECKIAQTQRSEVYRQVRRYASEGSLTSIVLFAPWSGVVDFIVDETPVTIIDWSKRSL